MNPFDNTLFHALNHFAGHTPVVDPIMAFVAQYGLEIYALLLVVAWFTLPRREENQRHALVVAVVGGVIAVIVSALIGAIWFRPRPFTVHGFHDNKIIPHPADASFPSDHATGGFAISSALWGRGPSWLSWVMTLFSILVMIARVYVGVHWPTDVLGGMLIGVVCGRVALLLSRPIRFVTNIGLWVFRMGHYAPDGRAQSISR